jgi:hypothetical protein
MIGHTDIAVSHCRLRVLDLAPQLMGRLDLVRDNVAGGGGDPRGTGTSFRRMVAGTLDGGRAGHGLAVRVRLKRISATSTSECLALHPWRTQHRR